MIPSLNLDDQNVRDIFEIYLTRMAHFYGQDLDTSYQDPGVALLELFSLLKDMQQFYMNYVDDAHRLKYMKLLGFAPCEEKPAKTLLRFSAPELDEIPEGFVVKAGNVPFATVEPVIISRNRIRFVAVSKDNDIVPVTEGESFYPFGKPIDINNVLVVGFEKDLSQFPAARIYIDKRISKSLPKPLGSLRAEAFDGVKWERLDITDGTDCFMKSGFICLNSSVSMSPKRISEEYPPLFWIRFTLEDNFYELAPEIGGVFLNTVPAVQTPCLGAAGNVRKDMINDTGDDGISAVNIKAAEGGCDRESISELMESVKRDYDTLYRAVTAEDYSRILLEASMLELDAAKAVVEDGVIVIYVKPKSDRPLSGLNEAYRSYLMRLLDMYRILTTQIRLEPPSYWGVAVYAELLVNSAFTGYTDQIAEKLHTLLPDAKHADRFSAQVSYGDVYGLIAVLPFVKRVHSLWLECGGKQISCGSMKLPEGAIAYLEDIKITLVRES